MLENRRIILRIEVNSVSITTSFNGEYTRTLDSKNRIVLPPQYKEEFPEGKFRVVCFPKDTFIRIYKSEELDEILKDKVFVQGGGDQMQLIQRLIYSCLAPCTLDGQSRFTIPQKLIEIAGINKEVKMIGIGNRIELWNPDRLEESFNNITEETLNSISFDF